MRTWRIDDVSVNTDMGALSDLMEEILADVGSRVMLAINPCVIGKEMERPFPARMKPLSDVREYFKATHCGLPILPAHPMFAGRVITAGHGMVHVDHRLLDTQTQELSVLMSCSLARADHFVPPYNYWDASLLNICVKHGIELVRYEEGWRHVKHNKYGEAQTRWYLHPWDVTVQEFRRWRSA